LERTTTEGFRGIGSKDLEYLFQTVPYFTDLNLDKDAFEEVSKQKQLLSLIFSVYASSTRILHLFE
jgi:hypothetical protein